MQSCLDKDVLKGGCVKVEYVGISDSYCGGPDKIRIIRGASKIVALYPGSVCEDGAIITTKVPDTMKKAGTVIYFQPQAITPKMCTANVMWYTEVQMLDASLTRCPK
jgi:hypothetical protein